MLILIAVKSEYKLQSTNVFKQKLYITFSANLIACQKKKKKIVRMLCCVV